MVTTFLTYISPLIPDTELKTVSTEGIDSSTSRQSQDRDISHLESFLAKHILDSTQGGMLTILLRMDESGVIQDMKKMTLEDNIFTLRNLVIKRPSQEYPPKSEGYQNSGPCSELTKTKIKAKLEGKDDAVRISEDDGNNSFLQKSKRQDEITEDSRTIPQTSETEIRNTFNREGEKTQYNTHLSDTSEMRDEIKEDYSEITNTFGTEGETTQDGTHISETSEMQDQTETQDQTEMQDQTETQDETESQDETEMQDQTEVQFQLQIKAPSHRQGYTTEDQKNISHREDGKERAKRQVSHRETSTTKDDTKISHIEDRKTQGQVSHRQSSTIEDNRMVSHREDRKQTAQPIDVSHRQSTSTENNRMVSDREDRKQTAQPIDVSHRRSTSTKNNRMVSDREDRKQRAQGRVSHGQGSTTEHNRKIANREDGKEAAQV